MIQKDLYTKHMIEMACLKNWKAEVEYLRTHHRYIYHLLEKLQYHGMMYFGDQFLLGIDPLVPVIETHMQSLIISTRKQIKRSTETSNTSTPSNLFQGSNWSERENFFWGV